MSARKEHTNKSILSYAKYKFIQFILLVILLVSFAHSANEPKIYIETSSDEISPGDSIFVSVGVTEGDSIISVLMFLNYNEEIFDFVKGNPGKLFQGATFTDIHKDTIDQDVMLYLMAVTLGAGRYVSAPGEFFNLKFVALDTGSAVFKIDSLLFYNLEMQRISGTSDILISTVTPDTFPPDPITDFKVLVGSEELTFSWRVPTDADFEGTLILKSKEGFIDSISSIATIAYQDSGNTFTDDGLENNVTYYYSAFTYDEIPNYSSPVFIKGEPKEEYVYAYPNPFNPDEHNATIKAIFPYDALINISIYDAVGNLVINLIKNESVDSGMLKKFYWDGKNGNGDIVANGVYYLVIKTGQGADKIEKLAVLR